MKLWFMLTEENKEKLVKLAGKKWTPPKRDKRTIQCEVKIEGLPEGLPSDELEMIFSRNRRSTAKQRKKRICRW